MSLYIDRKLYFLLLAFVSANETTHLLVSSALSLSAEAGQGSVLAIQIFTGKKNHANYFNIGETAHVVHLLLAVAEYPGGALVRGRVQGERQLPSPPPALAAGPAPRGGLRQLVAGVAYTTVKNVISTGAFENLTYSSYSRLTWGMPPPAARAPQRGNGTRTA